MKSDKLQEALGMIENDLLDRAEEKPKKNKKWVWKWSAGIAAMLVFALCIGIIFGNDSPMGMKVYAISEAEYPKMAPYPNENSPNFSSACDAWSADKKERRAYFGQGAHLDNFMKTTAAELLSDADGENRVYSPLNIYMALAMLAEITDGESRAQILSLLGEENVESLRKTANAVWNANYSNDGAVTSILASSIWLNEDISFNQATLKKLAEIYYASSYQGEMGSDDLNKALQNWLNEQTGGLLKDQIDSIEMSPDTILALATTIYFQAKWAEEFQDFLTEKDIFHGAIGDTSVDFMKQTLIWGNYYWGEKFSATYKELEGSGKMWFILPDENVSIDELLANEEALAFLSNANEHKNKKRMQIHLSVPKFDVDSQIDLTKELQSLGITDCFDMQKADFSPLLTADMDVALSEAKHGARVTIDEDGVTATAYTVMIAAGAPMPPDDQIDFVLDRPFIFVIIGSDNLPLFMGVVNQIS